MFEIKTQLIINVSVEKVWACLMDTEKYPVWNTFIHKVHGSFFENNKLTIEIGLPGDKPMKFSPVCTVLKKNSELRWVGKIGYHWIFKAEHYFILEKIDDNKTRFIQGEKFSGLLCGIFKKFKAESTQKGFDTMNKNLSHYLVI